MKAFVLEQDFSPFRSNTLVLWEVWLFAVL